MLKDYLIFMYGKHLAKKAMSYKLLSERYSYLAYMSEQIERYTKQKLTLEQKKQLR